MAYTPTEWVSGDIVTAAKLNHIEQGVINAGGTQITATVSETGMTLNASYNDLKNILLSGSTPFFIRADGNIEQDGYEEILRYEIYTISYESGEGLDYPYSADAVSGQGSSIGFNAVNATDNMIYLPGPEPK